MPRISYIATVAGLGVPVIGCDIRGVRDLLHDCGYLAPVGNVEALASAMRRVVHKRDAARAKAEAARRRVAQYVIHNLMRLHEQLYTEILGGRPCTVAA